MSCVPGKFVAFSLFGIVAVAFVASAFTVSSSSSSSSPSASTGTNNSSPSTSNRHQRRNNKKSRSIMSSSHDEENDMNSSKKPNIENKESSMDSINLKPIGKISSVYRLCVGTPRQGLLAPNSRGRIDLYPHQISPDSVQELHEFSHLWIVFVFHLNSSTSKQRGRDKQFTAKISPPALGGRKVGIFATRTPHRPNPIGFSLCQIDEIVVPPKKKHIKAKDQPYSIYVSGLDLVDGTPVLDIKPYVPHYDSVGYNSGTDTNEEIMMEANDNNNDDNDNAIEYTHGDDDNNGGERPVRIPQWISEGLEKRRPVTFTYIADEQLTEIMTNDDTVKQLEFYGAHTRRDETNQQALQRIKLCIEEVLSVDVRSTYQTKKARKGKFKAERAVRVSDITSSPTSLNTTATTTTTTITTTTTGLDSIKNNQASYQNHGNMNGINSPGDNNHVEKSCTQQLDRLLIRYSVKANSVNTTDAFVAVDTSGSGADDTIIVREVSLIPKSK